MKKNAIKLLSLCLTLLLLTACGSKSAETPASETVSAVTTAPAEPLSQETPPQETIPQIVAEDHIIVTSLANLTFPGDWAPFLCTEITEGDPCSVLFLAKLDTRPLEHKLYKITLGGEAEGAVGAIQAEDGTWYAVKTETYSFEPDDTWTDRDINIIFTMQNTLDYVLQKLDMEEPAVLEEEEDPARQEQQSTEASDEQVVSDSLKVDTPYMELHYPVKWLDYVFIEVQEGDHYSVEYSCSIGDHEKQHLFTVHFGGDQGSSLKTIKAESGEMVEIRIELTEMELDGTWSAEERSIVTAMQEDLNYLLSKMS